MRRRQREQRTSVPEADRSVPDGAWSALLTAVHEEVRRLPDEERTAFVLCDLEGVRQPDAAVRLGWPLGTLSSRLYKARKRLLDRLNQRGIAPGVLALGGLTVAAGTVPAALLKQVCFFPASQAGVSSTVAGLASGLWEGVTMQMKLVAVTLVVAGLLGFGGGAVIVSMARAQPGQAGENRPGQLLKVVNPESNDPQGEQPDNPSEGGGKRKQANKPPTEVGKDRGLPRLIVGTGTTGPIGQPSAWDYKFVDGKNMDRGKFEKDLAHLGGEGWEYIGSERLRGEGEQIQVVLVFKRQRGSTVGSHKDPAVLEPAPQAGPAGQGDDSRWSPDSPVVGSCFSFG